MSSRRIVLAAALSSPVLAACSAWTGEPGAKSSSGSPQPWPSASINPTPVPVVAYTNKRFGFSTRYPKGWRVRETTNGDGAEFSDGLGGAMTVWGANVDGDNAGKEHQEELGRLKAEGWYISFEFFKANYSAEGSYSLVTAERKGSYRYRRVISGKKSSVAVEWSHPTKQAKRYQPLVKATPKWITVGDTSQTH